MQISSGLGEAPPLNIIVLPVALRGRGQGGDRAGLVRRFSEIHQSFLDQLTESIGIVLNTIAANMRTEELLKQSQSLTAELQSQQEELKKTNERLEQQAATLRQSEELLRSQAGGAAADQRGAGGEGAPAVERRTSRWKPRTARSSRPRWRWRRRPSSWR